MYYYIFSINIPLYRSWLCCLCPLFQVRLTNFIKNNFIKTVLNFISLFSLIPEILVLLCLHFNLYFFFKLFLQAVSVLLIAYFVVQLIESPPHLIHYLTVGIIVITVSEQLHKFCLFFTF